MFCTPQSEHGPIAARVAQRYFNLRQARYRTFCAVLGVIGNNSAGALGQVVYAEFLFRGVRGLLPNVSIAGPRETDQLNPRDRRAAVEFGTRVYRLLVHKFLDADLVDDAIQQFLHRVVVRGLPLEPSTNLARAEAYVTQALINQVRDLLRARRRDQTSQPDVPESPTPNPIGDGATTLLDTVLPGLSRSLLIKGAADSVDVASRSLLLRVKCD